MTFGGRSHSASSTVGVDLAIGICGRASGPARSGRESGVRQASLHAAASFVAAVATPHPLLRLARRQFLYRTMVNAPLGVFPLLEKGM